MPGRGLSPRGRGNPRRHACLSSPTAVAGEPRWIRHRRVYPRAGGGTIVVPRTSAGSRRAGGGTVMRGRSANRQGLSPRGRGNLHIGRPIVGGSIPARAGEPCTFLKAPARAGEPWRPSQRVYPRAGGGTAIKVEVEGLERSPTIWDTRAMIRIGSIPARAGDRRRQVHASSVGSIPARAGEPGSPRWFGCGPPVKGLSPRGRGNPWLPSP